MFTKIALIVLLGGNLLVWLLLSWMMIGIGFTSFLEPIVLAAAFQLSAAANFAALLSGLMGAWRSEPQKSRRRVIFVIGIILFLFNIAMIVSI